MKILGFLLWTALLLPRTAISEAGAGSNSSCQGLPSKEASSSDSPKMKRQESGQRLVLGKLLVRTAPSMHSWKEDGTFAARPDGWQGEALRVGVSGGEWSLDVPSDCTKLWISDLRLKGRVAILDSFSIGLAGDTVAVVRAWTEGRTVLHILDGETGTELRDLTVALLSKDPEGSLLDPDSASSWKFWDRGYLSERECSTLSSVRRNLASPLVVMPGSLPGPILALIKADGYSWERVPFDPRWPSERTIRLRPASTVRCMVKDLPDSSDYWFARLCHVHYADHQAPFAELPIHGESVAFGNIPRGVYELRIEEGRDHGAPKRAVAKQIEVESEVAVVEAPAFEPDRDGPHVDWHPVTIRLFVPESWGEYKQGGGVSIRSRDGQEIALPHWKSENALGGTVYTAGPALVPEGPGLVQIRPMGCQWDIMVDSSYEDEKELNLSVPERAHIELRVDSEDRDKALEQLQVGWYPAPTHGWLGRSYSIIRPDPDDVIRFEAPAGRIELELTAEGYQDQHRQYEIRPGRNEIHATLSSPSSMVLVFFEDGTLIPAPTLNWNIVDVETLGRAVHCSIVEDLDSLGIRLFVPSGGDYALRFRDLAGYKAVSAKSVTVGPGSSVTVRVDLERE